ncbi:hypothetical protein J2T38_002332, partial [Neisseria perflava]|uniref:hypothetical protein n=1 Tax=Neisseria perflava TaxID=33053 RepID=UPI002646848B
MEEIGTRELASLLSISQQAVNKRALKEHWIYKEVKARGGRLKKYLVASLPLDIQTAIKEKTAADLLAQSR